MYKIAIAGTGYVGLVSGVCLAEKGYFVTCVDVDENKIAMLNRGECPIYEPGLKELMTKNKARLTYTTDTLAAYKHADVIFIAVGTPERPDGSANLDYVYSVAGQIACAIEKEAIVVIKSTVPVGTNDEIFEHMQKLKAPNVNIEIASNPEFLSQGTAVVDFLQATRIIIGTKTQRARQVLEQIYSVYEQPIVSTDIKSAELIKYASNDFLALKISYINEIANLCEITGADVEQVAKGMGLDPRIGDKFLKAGIGYGGSCFPKDTKALHWLAICNEYKMKIIKATIDVNESQKRKLFDKTKQYYPDLKGKRAAVLGLTFKPDTDDLRDAPSLINIPLLKAAGACVYAWDPVGSNNYLKIDKDIIICPTIEKTLENADICFIFTEWPEILSLDVSLFAKLMKTPIILDGRNCYPLKLFENQPVIYNSIGRRTINNLKEKIG